MVISMRENRNSIGLKASILAMSFLQMATNAVASILADIAAQFPDASVSAVQYLMTFPNLLVVAVSMLAAWLSARFPKRNLAAAGLLLGAFSGICSFLFHGSLPLLYVWAGMLGTGTGLTVPVAMSLISDYFDGKEKDTMLGYQTTAANVGSMLMTFFGGMLASLGWNYNYLVYLLALPGFILTCLFVPGTNVSERAPEPDGGKARGADGAGKKGTRIRIPGYTWFYFATAAVFMLLFYMGPTNLSLLVEERGTGTAMTAGTAATLLLFGGSVMGLFFGKLAARLGRYTIVCGYVMLFFGYLLIYGTREIPFLYLGSFLVGTSNTLVLPQCMGQMVTEDKRQSTFLMSAGLAVANLGTFLAPVLTNLAALVMGTRLAGDRFLFTGILAAVLAAVSAVYIRITDR